MKTGVSTPQPGLGMKKPRPRDGLDDADSGIKCCVKREYLNNIMRGVKVNSKTLSNVAPTLTDLKKLPRDQKCRLLLARLAEIGHHDSALNKHNLMMPGDPYALAYGYPDAEKTPVREHLLGAPWTRLLSEGYLVDLTGQGFYKVTEEGRHANTPSVRTSTCASTTAGGKQMNLLSWIAIKTSVLGLRTTISVLRLHIHSKELFTNSDQII